MTDSPTQFGRVPTAVVSSGALATLTPATQAVYLAVCAFAGRNWRSTVGQRRIANATGVHLDTVRLAMRTLREAGLIQSDDPGSGKRQTHTIATNRTGESVRFDSQNRTGESVRFDKPYGLSGQTVRIERPNRTGESVHVQTLQSRSELHAAHASESATPRRPAKKQKPTDTTGDRAAIFEALANVTGQALDSLTRSARGVLNRAARDLAEVDATPAEIKKRGQAYRAKYPKATLTAPALAKHWPTLGDDGSGAADDDGYAWLQDIDPGDIVPHAEPSDEEWARICAGAKA